MRARLLRVRLTARGRLALLYTALVLAAGVLLSGLTYLLVRQGLKHRLVVGVNVGSNPGTGRLPPNADELAAVGRRVRAETLSELLTQAAIALAVVTVIVAVLGWLVAGRVLRPLRTIAATAGRLSAENLSERVPVTTPADELATLASTINHMLDRIQSGVTERERLLESQKMFTANAAHELRTPLTTMRTAIDVTLDGDPTKAELLTMADDITTAITHSQRTLDGLLALARSQARPVAGRRVDLADIAADVLGKSTGEAERLDITVEGSLEPAPTSGDPVLLERMVGNLVDNALRYNHTGGHMAVTTGTTAGCGFLQVTNTGRPVAPDEAGRLLEPFVRGTGTRTRTEGGTGLGLSIVRAITLAHHGDITTDARPSGGGLDILIRLPSPHPNTEPADRQPPPAAPDTRR